ncbi:MAG TPA: DUF3237 domain-containing protein [Methylomirabilota bacterium]|nr:DUF3237 domain-containing protein [Methylomirabilota bacterium]
MSADARAGVRTEYLYDVVMTAEVDDLGLTPAGHRRIVRVTGGTFEGPRLRGTGPGVMARLLAGDPVDPSDYYFRTAPLFETASDRYAWLNRLLAVGIGRRTREHVAYTMYAVL